MNNRRTTIEWSVGEDDAVWQEDTPVAPAPTARNLAERRLAILVMILFLLLAGGWIWHRQTRLATVESELQAKIALEAKARPAGEEDPLATPASQSSPSPGQYTPSGWQARTLGYTTGDLDQPTVQIHEYHLRADKAIAQTTVRYPAETGGVDGDMLAYRETHFYRQTAEGWDRMSPDPDLLGPWQTLETAHFTFRFRSIDASAVTTAAPRLDRLYNQMRRDFGLPTTGAQPRIAVEVTSTEATGGRPLNEADQVITVPSPALLSVPVEWTPEMVFYQSLVYPLSGLAAAEVVASYPPTWNIRMPQWQPVLQALRLWTLWEDAGPLAVWREDVVHWLYQNRRLYRYQIGQSNPGDVRDALPDAYEAICRTYGVWDLSPWEMSIPLFCSEMDERLWVSWTYPHLPLRLDELTVLSEHRPPPALSMGRMVASIVAMETVLEYVEARYGREQLPVLVDALDEYPTWERLLPAVFGVSAAEFEANWHAYLAERYEVEPSMHSPD